MCRFAAVFHTNDSDPVGPIRSGRSQDVDLLTPFNDEGEVDFVAFGKYLQVRRGRYDPGASIVSYRSVYPPPV